MILIYSDNIMHEEEEKIVDEMIEYFELKKSLSIVYSQWSKSILALYTQGQALIDL
jgi:hypothetical protein